MSFVGKWFSFGKDPSFDEGIRAYEKREFATALASFQESLTHANDKATIERAKNYVAGCLGKLAREAASLDPQAAIEYLNQALELREGFADLWLQKASILLEMGETEAATEAANRALQINPYYGSAFALVGTIQYAKGLYQESLHSLTEAARLDPRLNNPEYQQALEFHKADDHAACLDKLKHLRPSTTDVNDLVMAGDSHAKDGDWEAAKESYAKAVAAAPDYADVRSRYGQAHMELNELDEAILEFNHAVKANPSYAEAYALLGIAYRRLDNEEMAHDYFKMALKVDPNHPIASQEILYRRR